MQRNTKDKFWGREGVLFQPLEERRKDPSEKESYWRIRGMIVGVIPEYLSKYKTAKYKAQNSNPGNK